MKSKLTFLIGTLVVLVLSACTVHIERNADGSLPPDWTVIATHTSALADVLGRCNKTSQNLFAECLLKTLGYHHGQAAGQADMPVGGWTTGRAAIRRGGVGGRSAYWVRRFAPASFVAQINSPSPCRLRRLPAGVGRLPLPGRGTSVTGGMAARRRTKPT